MITPAFIELHIAQSRSNRTITINVSEIESYQADPNGDGANCRLRTKSGETHFVVEGQMEIKRNMQAAIDKAS